MPSKFLKYNPLKISTYNTVTALVSLAAPCGDCPAADADPVGIFPSYSPLGAGGRLVDEGREEGEGFAQSLEAEQI